MASMQPVSAGVFIVDKPTGMTSHDVVDRVRKVAGTRRVGHAGTLDPAASGVLVVAFGPATRFLEYVVSDSKGYHATVRLGTRTDTFDLDGEILETADVSEISELDVRAALAPLEGEIMQLPPMYSAVKVDGEPLYKRARRGDDVLREPRKVTVSRLALTEIASPDVWLEIDCSKGTYIRALAESLGENLGCGAVLASLRRTRSGRFSLDQATPLDDLTMDSAQGMEFLLGHLPPVELDEDSAKLFCNGGRVPCDAEPSRSRVHVDGQFLGVGEVAGGQLRPIKVMSDPTSPR